jgi:hypothetical protein
MKTKIVNSKNSNENIIQNISNILKVKVDNNITFVENNILITPNLNNQYKYIESLKPTQLKHLIKSQNEYDEYKKQKK